MTVTYCGIVRISQLNTIHSAVIAQLKLESALIDFCGDYIVTCLPHIMSLLYKALGQRVTLIAAKPLPDMMVSFICYLWFFLTGLVCGVTLVNLRESGSY